jgi:SAM-dependent methyltransferase
MRGRVPRPARPDRQTRSARLNDVSGDRQRRQSFNNVADIYHRVRPGYPDPMFVDLFSLLPMHPRVLEVGPGTGQATRDLLKHGATVHAIEIGPSTARKLREVLTTDELGITVGDFEEVPIEHRAYDCVFSATAYHWISPGKQLDRPAELLKPQGVVAVVDLIQVDSPNDRGFFAAAQPIYARHGEGHVGPPAPKREQADLPIRSALDSDPRFERVTLRRYDWDQTYTAAQYRDLMLSFSPTQMMDAQPRERLLDDMESFIKDEFADCVVRPLVATMITASRVA